MGREPSIGHEAWTLLVGVFLAHRSVWLAAGQAEGLTPPQAVSLMRLSADDPPSLGELARHMHCDASYATTLADRLEERGFVERRVSATDRRVKELVPTRAGLAAQKRLQEAFTSPPPGLLELSDDDQRALLRVARLLFEHSDPEVAERMGIALPRAPAPG